jgi:UDP:flavonoid glycosyltransferase YjiC (YdhE family)
MTALARKLQARNHEVIFLYSSDAAGLPVFFEENSAEPNITRKAIAFDQPSVAARIAYRQTGVVTSLDKLTPDHLSELLDEVLINPIYRANAKNLQRKIIEANGLAVAADLVERALGIKEKSNAL